MNIEDCFKQLDLMAELEDGWDSYGAAKPTTISVQNAREFCEIAVNARLLPGRVLPSVMGGVGVTFGNILQGGVYVEFYNKGTAHSLFVNDVSSSAKTFPVPTCDAGYKELVDRAVKYLAAKEA